VRRAHKRCDSICCQCGYTPPVPLHAVVGLFGADLRRAAIDPDLDAGANAVVGHHINRAAADARGPDLARLGDRGHISVIGKVAQFPGVGQHLPVGLHALHEGIDVLCGADLQLQAGLVDLHGFGVAGPGAVAAGDGMDRGAGLSDVGLNTLDLLPGLEISLVGRGLFQPRDLVAARSRRPEDR